MPSFLDFDNPEVRTGLGLLALGQMPKSQGFAGLLDIANARDTSKRMQAKTAMENAAFERQKQEWLAADQAEKAAAAQRAAIPSLFTLGPAGEVAGFDTRRAIELGLTPKQIEDFANVRNVGRSEVARTVEGLDEQGRPTTFQFDKFGNRVGDGLQQWKAPISVNQGDKTTFVDAVSLTPKQSFAMGMSPEARDASARGWASNALARERLNLERSDFGPGGAKAPAGYRWGADGNLVAIPGGPAEKSNVATEGERKAATLLQRLEGSQSQYANALKDEPDAAKPGLIANNLRAIGAETLANIVTGENRQRVEAAQLDMLDAALTLGTGAAYNKEQLEGYRKSFFPQIGDDPKTVEEKQARLDNVIASARIAAGRSANLVPPKSPATTPPTGAKSFDALPPALQYNGKRMRGPDGTVYRSVNGQWTRE